MKTIKEALKGYIGNAWSLLGASMLENILIERGCDPDKEFTAETAKDKAFVGCRADALYALVDTPNISESDISISLQDRDLILKKANLLYRTIGEEEKSLDQPTVCIGPPPGTYVSY